jgi:hypothetical protein
MHRFSGTVSEGRFVPDDKIRWAAVLGKLEKRRVHLDVDGEARGHSSNQRRYYFGVVVATIAEWSGHSKDEIHGFMKRKFLPVKQITLPTGEIVETEPTTTTLDLEGYSGFVSDVMRWAAEQGLYVPSPEEMG